MRRAALAVGAGVAFIVLAGSAFAQDFPRFSNHVVDAADVVPDDAEERINAQLAGYQKRSTNQVAVAVVEDLDDTSIEDYSEDLFDEWGIGQKDKDNGVLLVIAMAERDIRIEVGYGVEGDLTDLESGRIVDAMAPLMRQGDIGGAIEQATNAIRFQLGDTEATQPLEPEPEPEPESDVSFFWVLPLLFFVGAGLFGRRRGRRRRDFSLWPLLLGGSWGGSSGGFGGGGFGGGGGGFGGGGGGGSGGGGASGGW